MSQMGILQVDKQHRAPALELASEQPQACDLRLIFDAIPAQFQINRGIEMTEFDEAGPWLPHSDNTIYHIDGFRSLLDFKIQLTPGLNVLVGANGSGKTNFLDFLEFLSLAISNGGASAVSAVGGISRVFSQEHIRRSSPSIKASVKGLATLRESIANDKCFLYEYEIELRFSRDNAALYISREYLKFWKLHRSNERSAGQVAVGSICVTRRSPAEDAVPSWKVGPRLYADNDRNPMNVFPSYYTMKTASGMMERLQGAYIAPDESFLSSRFPVPAVDAVRRALTRGRSFNILPEQARQPDDVSKPPLIGKDGSGLSSLLHNLQFMRRTKKRRPTYRTNANPMSMDMLIHWTRMVFPDLMDIAVTADPHTGKYQAYLIVGKDNALRIPMQSASDGTVKWLCFIGVLVSMPGTYSFEEPENFLHPKMQQFLAELIRESMDGRNGNEHLIMSTHSETMINQFRPEELVIFDFVENRTHARRISNPQAVQSEINRGGFGLGYYYASNSIG